MKHWVPTPLAWGREVKFRVSIPEGYDVLAYTVELDMDYTDVYTMEVTMHTPSNSWTLLAPNKATLSDFKGTIFPTSACTQYHTARNPEEISAPRTGFVKPSSAGVVQGNLNGKWTFASNDTTTNSGLFHFIKIRFFGSELHGVIYFW